MARFGFNNEKSKFKLRKVCTYFTDKRICLARNPQPACLLVFKDGKSQGKTTNLQIQRENEIKQVWFYLKYISILLTVLVYLSKSFLLEFGRTS